MNLSALQPSAFAARITDADPDVLWGFVSDPHALVDFSDELQAVRVVTEGPIRLGSQFEGDQRRGDRGWTTLSTVTSFEPTTFFEWTVGPLDAPVSRWAFILDASDAGLTVVHRAVLLGGRSPLADYLDANPLEAPRIVHDRLALFTERMGQTIEGLIALAGGRVVA
jgi:hypothetical protein